MCIKEDQKTGRIGVELITKALHLNVHESESLTINDLQHGSIGIFLMGANCYPITSFFGGFH